MECKHGDLILVVEAVAGEDGSGLGLGGCGVEVVEAVGKGQRVGQLKEEPLGAEFVVEGDGGGLYEHKEGGEGGFWEYLPQIYHLQHHRVQALDELVPGQHTLC